MIRDTFSVWSQLVNGVRRTAHNVCSTKPLLTVGLLVSVAACQTYSGPPVFSSDKHIGKYKVGEPYQIDGTWYTPQADENYEEEGVASWYGPGFHKKLTANGDKFDENALTAAHRTLPMPSMVRVTNLDNGRSLVVMVNDRGPFSKGRILDLSARSAEILGFKDKGIANVRVKFLPGQTRRLLAQLDVKDQIGGNPFATSDGNFGYSDDETELANRDEVTSFMDGLDIPLPEHFSISNDAMESAPKKESAASSDAPIGLVNEYNDGMKNFAKAVEKEQAVVSAHNDVDVKQLPSSLPQNTVEPVKIKAPTAMQSSMQADASDETVIDDEIAMAEDEVAVPEGKVMLDKDDPRYVEQVYFIQAGSFRMKENALRVKESLSILGEKTEVDTVEVAGANISRVRLGPFYNEDRAKQTLQRVIGMGHADALMVAD